MQKEPSKAPYDPTLPQKLYDLRLKWDLTQAQAAEKLNVSRQTIGRWETGAKPMPEKQYRRALRLIDDKSYEEVERRIQQARLDSLLNDLI